MGEHGPHAVLHGPDNWLYIVAGNHSWVTCNKLAENSPLRRNVTIDQVGNAAVFLLSDLTAGITGEILMVDGGFSRVVGGIGVTSSPDSPG